MSAVIMGLLWACNPVRQETPVPRSWQTAKLEVFEPPEILEDLSRWLPDNAEVRFFKAMTEKDAGERRRQLQLALNGDADSPVILAALSREWADAGDWEKAMAYADLALQADPGNALLDLWRARTALGAGKLPEARLLFFGEKSFTHCDSYRNFLENRFLSAMTDAGRFNPYSLTEAQGLFARIPWPDWEGDLEILREVFLDSLGEHPYDIRLRAPEAALRLVWSGISLRQQSLQASGILWDGLDDRALGYAMEVKGWAFLKEFGKAFGRRRLSEMADMQGTRALREADAVLTEAALASRRGMAVEYLDAFAAWSRDRDMTVQMAISRAHGLKLWRHAQRRYSSGLPFEQ